MNRLLLKYPAEASPFTFQNKNFKADIYRRHSESCIWAKR